MPQTPKGSGSHQGTDTLPKAQDLGPQPFGPTRRPANLGPCVCRRPQAGRCGTGPPPAPYCQIGRVLECPMRIIALRTLREFWERHPKRRPPYGPGMPRPAGQTGRPRRTSRPPTATSFLPNGRAVFNIRGNDYRLVVAVRFATGLMFVRFVGTHAEYDRIDAASI